MAKINIDKIYNEISKGETIDEKIQAYYDIKNFVAQLVTAEQQIVESKANELQNTLDRINGN